MSEILVESPALTGTEQAQEQSLRGSVRAYMDLAKPGVTRLVILTTALGAVAAPGRVDWGVLGTAVFGTTLVVAGANALNMFMERDTDALMTRTRTRPLPSGRLSPDAALAFGVFVSLLGLVVLAQFTTMLAVAVATFALLSYVLVYTPLKRVGPIALYVGAVPGALPPVIGYAAARGGLDEMALCLFLILFVWQIPHFLAITLFRAAEYARAGLQVMPVVRGAPATRRALVWSAGALLLVALLPYWAHLAGVWYLAAAALSSLAYLALASLGLGAQADERWARKVFFASMPHLVLLYAALVTAAA